MFVCGVHRQIFFDLLPQEPQLIIVEPLQEGEHFSLILTRGRVYTVGLHPLIFVVGHQVWQHLSHVLGLFAEALNSLGQLQGKLIRESLLMLHFAQNDPCQLHLNQVGVLQHQLWQEEDCRVKNSVATALIVLHVDGESSDESDRHTENDLRLFDAVADLKAEVCSILLKHRVQVVIL